MSAATPQHDAPVSRSPWLFVGLFLLLAACAFYVLRSWKLETDIWAFLPSSEHSHSEAEKKEAQLTRSLLQGSLQQALVLAIVDAAPDSDKLAPAQPQQNSPKLASPEKRMLSKELAERLQEVPGVQKAESGPDPRFQDAVYDLYFARRYHFARPQQGALFSADDLHARVDSLKEFLSSPAAAVYRSQLSQDPLLYFPEQIEALAALKPSGISLQEGQYVASDGATLIFVTLRKELKNKEHSYQQILAAFDELNDKAHYRLQMSGSLPFEVQGEAITKKDVERVGTLSLIMVLLLSFLLFGGVFPLLLILLPVGVGLLTGCTATLFFFDSLHVLTLAFGATLIGVSLDYPLHLLNDQALHQDSLRQASRRVRMGLLIGSGTTVMGFVAFASTSAPALAQVAVFSIFGLLGALFTTLLVLPRFALKSGQGKVQRYFAEQLARVLPKLSAHAKVLGSICLLLIIAGGLYVQTSALHLDPAELNPASRQQIQDDKEVRERLGLSEELFVVHDKSEAQALEKNHQLALELKKRSLQGKELNYRSLDSLLLPPSVQTKNAQAAASSQTAQLLNKALADAGFSPEAFSQSRLGDPSLLEVQPLTWQLLQQSPLASISAAMMNQSREGTSIVTHLSASEEELRSIAQAQPQANRYAPQRYLAQAFTQLAHDVRSALWGCFVLMLILVALRQRALRATMSAFAPAALGSLGALTLLLLSGSQLHVFHLLAAIVVLSMGIDYGTFMVEAHRSEDLPTAWPSVLGAAISTLVSFGSLALSQVPALKAMGSVIALGILIALFSTPLSYALLGQKKRTSVEPPCA